MSSRALRLVRRLLWREQQVAETQNEHQETVQAPMVPEIEVTAPPTIDLDPIDDDDDDDEVVELTASAFAQAKSKSRRRPLVVDVESGCSTRLSKTRKRARTNEANDECDEPNKTRKKTVVEEPKFNCPICLSPLTEEVSTKCGHIFCSGCIRTAISSQAKCPTCRKKVKAKELIRVFLPATQIHNEETHH